MTTAHRPTFDPARGKEALRGPAYHQRLLPAHTQLKFRKPGQGGDADNEVRDLRAELLAAEAAHFAKQKGGASLRSSDDNEINNSNGKRPLPIAAAPSFDGPGQGGGGGGDADDGDDPEAKRRRILEETRDIDADDPDDSAADDDDDNGGGDDDDDDSSSDEDSDDEDAELQRELARVRRERQEKREKEERERAAAEEEARERDIALGNPLLNKTDFNIKRRWDDDVVFKNQARGTEERGKKEFVNDLLRSDFHKRFMSKYVR